MGDVLSAVRSPMSFRLLWPKIRVLRALADHVNSVFVVCWKTKPHACVRNKCFRYQNLQRENFLCIWKKVSKLLTNVASVSMSSCSTRERFSKVSFVAGGGSFGPIVTKFRANTGMLLRQNAPLGQIKRLSQLCVA